MVGYTNLQCPRARLDSTSPCPDLTSHPLLYMYWYIACARGAFVSTSHGHTEGHLTTPDPLSRGRPTPGLSTTALERPTKDNLARIAATLRVSSGAGGFVFALLDDFQSHPLAKVFLRTAHPLQGVACPLLCGSLFHGAAHVCVVPQLCSQTVSTLALLGPWPPARLLQGPGRPATCRSLCLRLKSHTRTRYYYTTPSHTHNSYPAVTQRLAHA